MAEFKVVDGEHGKRYVDKRTGQLIARDDIPLIDRVKFWLVPLRQEFNNQCFFCGKESNLSRLLYGQAIVLCREHYYGVTIGKLAEAVRQSVLIREETELHGDERIRTKTTGKRDSQSAGAKENDRQLQEVSSRQG